MPGDRIVDALIRLTEAAHDADIVPLRADDAS
jgi:hypothetical protein